MKLIPKRREVVAPEPVADAIADVPDVPGCAIDFDALPAPEECNGFELVGPYIKQAYDARSVSDRCEAKFVAEHYEALLGLESFRNTALMHARLARHLQYLGFKHANKLEQLTDDFMVKYIASWKEGSVEEKKKVCVPVKKASSAPVAPTPKAGVKPVKKAAAPVAATAKPVAAAAAAAAPAKEKKKRQTIFDLNLCAFIRALGKRGYTFLTAKKIIADAGVDVADGTVRAQLNGGKTGKYGEPAALTKEILAKLVKYKE